MRSCAAILFLCMVASPAAQTPGTCERGEAQGDLDINDVFARVFNTGALFFGSGTFNGDGYLVPKSSGHSPMFASSVWIGGKVDGEIRVSGSRYTRYELWPGPLSDGGELPNPASCSEYDRIFVVSRRDVAHYLETGEATDDLRDWPASWGAPVLDGDGIEGNYNLAGGDQPAINGDQMAWWVMNDVGNVHEETGSNPLGLEVQASAFALAGGSLFARQMTFYRFVLANRSPNPIDSTYFTWFADPDLGDANDDRVGSDTTFGMGVVYNGDEDDAAYGVPPALGFQFVQGPNAPTNGVDDDRDGEIDEPGERLGMTSAMWVCSGCTQPEMSDPRTRFEYYPMMQGFWKDGTPMTASGNGYQTAGAVTRFAWPGDPVAGACWSEENDCEGSQGQPSDMRFIVSTGPFRLDPGESEEIVLALPFGQGTDRLDSIVKLRYAAEAARNAWDFDLLQPRRVEGEFAATFDLQVSWPYPNPFTSETSIRYDLSEPMHARLVVFDVLGREVAVLADGEQPAGPHEVVFDAVDRAPGVYIVRFEAAGEERSFTVVKLR